MMRVKAEDGFSLLELLVAIAILSLAVILMIDSQSTALRSASLLNEKALAEMVAENALTELSSSEIPPQIGTIRGTEYQAGIAFDWQANISRITAQNILTISVSVSQGSTNNMLYKVTGFRKSV